MRFLRPPARRCLPSPPLYRCRLFGRSQCSANGNSRGALRALAAVSRAAVLGTNQSRRGAREVRAASAALLSLSPSSRCLGLRRIVFPMVSFRQCLKTSLWSRRRGRSVYYASLDLNLNPDASPALLCRGLDQTLHVAPRRALALEFLKATVSLLPHSFPSTSRLHSLSRLSNLCSCPISRRICIRQIPESSSWSLKRELRP